jgi:DNA modification methylase
MARTLQPGGVLFLQVGSTAGPDGNPYPIDALIFSHLAAMGLTFQTRIAWVIPHGLTPKRRLAERYETALVFTKGPVPRVFNPNAIRLPQKQPGKKAFKGPNKGSLSGHPLGAFPSNVWQISNAGHNRQGATGEHPAQMPAELARRAILLYSNPGDLVCDTFAGSGTTQSEAIRTGRAFTGADLFYADTRAKRLAAVAPDLVTPLTGVTDESLAVWEAEAKPVHIGARPVSSIPAQAVLI